MKLKKRLFATLLAVVIHGMIHPVPHTHPQHHPLLPLDRQRHRVLMSRN